MADFRFPVQIGPYEFQLDLDGFERVTNQTMREQSDESQRTGEQSLSRNDLWRRTQFDFRGGYGQEWGDAIDSNPTRFFESSSADVWRRGRVSQLTVPTSPRNNGGASGQLLAGGGRLFLAKTNYIDFTDGTGFATADWNSLGYVGGEVKGMATDGAHLYAAVAGEGLQIWDVDAAAGVGPAVLNNLIADGVWYVKGRLMASAGADLYNITDVSDATPPAPITPLTINDGWKWTDMTGGGSAIYATGFAGDYGAVYRITANRDGTALDAPVSAAEFPLGEVPYSILAYRGLVFVGTSLGLRVAALGDGYLSYGPLIDVGPVHSLSAYGSNLYFGWAGGLGRVDLSAPLIDVLQPAYAPDMSSGVADVVQSVAIFDAKPYFTVGGATSAFYMASSTKAAAEIVTSRFDFNVPDDKAFEQVEIRTVELPISGEVQVRVFVDDALVTSGTFTEDRGTRFRLPVEAIGDEVYAEVTLTGGAVLSRVTFRAWPLPTKGETIQMPLVLRGEVQDRNGRSHRQNPKERFDYLRGLNADQSRVEVELFGDKFDAVVDAVGIVGESEFLPNQEYVEGTCVVALRTWT